MAWKNREAADMAIKLVKEFGNPTGIMPGLISWSNIPYYDQVWIHDEAIQHSFPKPHKDFIYSAIKIPEWAPEGGKSTVDPELVKTFASITGSIIIDGLKGEVVARCGMLIKNAVTLGFVQDVISGKAEATKEEYSNRILNDIVPDWYKDKLSEKEMMKKEDKKIYDDFLMGNESIPVGEYIV